MTSASSAPSLFPAKPERVFRFLWIGQNGPRVKLFTSIEAFSGYVAMIRQLLGPSSVEFRTPTLCIGVLL